MHAFGIALLKQCSKLHQVPTFFIPKDHVYAQHKVTVELAAADDPSMPGAHFNVLQSQNGVFWPKRHGCITCLQHS